MAMSATARTLQRLRKDGITAQKVEYYQHCVGQKFGRRIDLFGSIDIVALLEGDIVGIERFRISSLGNKSTGFQPLADLKVENHLVRNSG